MRSARDSKSAPLACKGPLQTQRGTLSLPIPRIRRWRQRMEAGTNQPHLRASPSRRRISARDGDGEARGPDSRVIQPRRSSRNLVRVSRPARSLRGAPPQRQVLAINTYPQVFRRAFAPFRVVKSRVPAAQLNVCAEFDSRQLHHRIDRSQRLSSGHRPIRRVVDRDSGIAVERSAFRPDM